MKKRRETRCRSVAEIGRAFLEYYEGEGFQADSRQFPAGSFGAHVVRDERRPGAGRDIGPTV